MGKINRWVDGRTDTQFYPGFWVHEEPFVESLCWSDVDRGIMFSCLLLADPGKYVTYYLLIYLASLCV